MSAPVQDRQVTELRDALGPEPSQGQPSPVGFLDTLQQALSGSATSTVHQRISLSRSGREPGSHPVTSRIACKVATANTVRSQLAYRPTASLRANGPLTLDRTWWSRSALVGKLVVCGQNQIVPTQDASPCPGVLRTLNVVLEVLAASTVENFAGGMATNGIGGHEREGPCSDERVRPATRPPGTIDHGSRE